VSRINEEELTVKERGEDEDKPLKMLGRSDI